MKEKDVIIEMLKFLEGGNNEWKTVNTLIGFVNATQANFDPKNFFRYYGYDSRVKFFRAHPEIFCLCNKRSNTGRMNAHVRIHNKTRLSENYLQFIKTGNVEFIERILDSERK